MWWVLALITSLSVGSKMTMSASEPTAMVPLRGNRPKSLAGVVETTSTKRFGGEAFAVDAAGVDEAEAMFDAGAAVGDFGEVVLA